MILEMVTFRVRPDISEAAFLQAVREADEFLASSPGFLARQVLTPAADGPWVDLVWWTDLAAARKAADAIGTDPRAARFLSAITPGSVSMSHASLAYSRGDLLQ